MEENTVVKKNNKGIIVILSILILIILGLVVYIAYDKDFIFEKEKVEEKKDKNNKKIKEEVEKDITDTTIISNLDQKLVYFDGISSIDSKSNSGSGYSFRNGEDSQHLDIFNNFNNDLKLRITLNSLSGSKQFESITDKNNTLIKRIVEIYGESSVTQISVSKVEEQYLKFFGTKVTEHKEIEGCYGYKYDKENSLYFKLDQQCGGTSGMLAYSYKNKYSFKGNETYVYVNYGLGILGTGIYKDVMHKEIYKSNVTDSDISNFKIDSTNYQDFSEYKYTFEKDKNNNYYFKSLEKTK